MKTLLAVLALGLLLSTNAYARKAEITIVWYGGDVTMQSCDETSCTFGCDTAFMASYFAHKDAALSLQLMVGEEETVTLASWLLRPYNHATVIWNSGCFTIPIGSDFSMVWVMENTKTGRILDAVEALSGTCEP